MDYYPSMFMASTFHGDASPFIPNAFNMKQPPSQSSTQSQPVLGVLAALLAVSIWGGWIVSTRHAALLHLSAAHLGVLRYGVPCLFLLPWLPRTVWWPRVQRVWLIPFIVAGGAPFFLVSAAGMRYAPAAQAGALQAGTMPLFIALLAWGVTRQKLHSTVWLGFAFILGGVLVIVGLEGLFGAHQTWLGHGLFLTASLLWSIYTLAFRSSGLSARQGVALLSGWSLLIHLGLVAFFQETSTVLANVSVPVLVWQAIIQGFGSGLLANVAYGYAVVKLGAVQAGAFLALVPVIATVGGALFLEEIPRMAEGIGVLLVAVGVTLAAGVLKKSVGECKA